MAFKDQLMTALHDAVGHFNSSGDPNSAVIKAAQDHDFNTEQTQRLVETFNTARTIYHYKSAADRTTTFALADRDDVMSALFGAKEEKTAAAVDFDYSQYGTPVRRYLEDSQEEKQAAYEQSAPELGLNLNNVTKEAMQAISVQRQVIRATSDEARVAAVKAAETMQKIANTFAYGDQSDRIARLTAGYMDDRLLGDAVTKMAEFIPGHRSPTSDQLMHYQRMSVIDDTDLGVQVELLKEAKAWMDVEAEMLAISGTLQKEADEFEREYAELFSNQFQGVKSAADLLKVADTETTATQKYTTKNLYGEPIEVESVSGGTPKDPNGLADMISSNTFESAQAPIKKFIETGVDRAFTQPMVEENKKLSERMKNVQRQIMLQDLMVNDPVLADESPETVAEAYNSLLQMAPEVAANKEVVRAILRQTVHSVAVSPYDAEMWTKLEGNLRNLRGKGPAVPRPGSSDQGVKR